MPTPSFTIPHVRPFLRMLTPVIVIACATAALAQEPPADGAADRHAHVREMGAAVMPFDVQKTLHAFVKTAAGGEQLVVVRDPVAHDDEVSLVRSHVLDVSEAFARGDFGDPTTIHGDAMPGVDVLSERHEAVTIRTFDVADGALIVFATDDDAVLAALHAWFDAQVGDHGVDAAMGRIDSVTNEAAWSDLYPLEPVPASFAGR